MGYCTNYTLAAYKDSDTKLEDNIFEELEIPENWEPFGYALERDGSFAESVKWYDHEKDMIKLSKNFSEYIFVLHGDGEEPGDHWRKYFYDGKMQSVTGQICFDMFDPAKLK